MAAIDELIEQIDNPTLRERISAEVQRMVKQKKFGLVFEEHLPERTLLHEIPVQRGSLVARNGNAKDVYQVVEIDGEKAKCFSKADREQVELLVSELTCVAEFGEPIYPYLEPLDSVENAPDSGLWHTLIEADNYHALQLLDYMYHGKVFWFYWRYILLCEVWICTWSEIYDDRFLGRHLSSFAEAILPCFDKQIRLRRSKRC